MIKNIKLDGVPIKSFGIPYIIAEIGQNHNGDIKTAKKLIDLAKHAGAHAVKFQKRDISSELTDEAYNAPYNNNNSYGTTYGEHREFLELDYVSHKNLFDYSKKIGITYFCTPCDIPSIEILEKINVPFYKVASRDLTNIPLLEKLSILKKPVIISTGMASIDDIDCAIEVLKLPKNKLIIMHCTSQYPCHPKNVNLKVIPELKKKYDTVVGYSDHTNGIITAVGAYMVGASIIEKHITLDRASKGTDHAGALEQQGLVKLIEYLKTLKVNMGTKDKKVLPDQYKIKIFI